MPSAAAASKQVHADRRNLRHFLNGRNRLGPPLSEVLLERRQLRVHADGEMGTRWTKGVDNSLCFGMVAAALFSGPI